MRLMQNLERRRFYIYINTKNGEEEQILKVVETQKGHNDNVTRNAEYMNHL